MTARRAAWALGAAALLMHLACGGRYGWFRDELYFLVWLCRRPRLPLAQVWPAVKHFE